MTTSVASSNFNMASSICFAEINLIAMSLAMLPVAETLRRYMPEEPGGFDPRKNRPATHLRKGQKAQRVQKQKLPKENNTVVVGMIGTTVIMKCDVGLNDYLFQVIWARHAKSVNETDAEILTVNTTTLVDDKRFLVTHDSEQKIWHLHIRYTKHKDKGIYECQVCNHPTFSIYVKLDLFEARAVILGPSVREVDRGFPIRLSCILNSTEHYRMKTPTYMFWYHDSRMINYDLKDGAVVREGRLGTELIFQRALPTHTGNYSCVPSNARQASVQVIVHYPGEQMPSTLALRSGRGTASRPPHPSSLTVLLALFAVTTSVYR
ncbi:uncharacterized protein LOC143196094 isoform X2 [Rhynchophorus ferrugineus]|uniref:uncharacterized protein LOC143196094 isoform X2 n=1 Tax=Rhynchophorus ferrugineus TaxID=354439 RepID=UPI003FCD5790